MTGRVKVRRAGAAKRAASDALLAIVARAPERTDTNWADVDVTQFLALAEYHRVGSLLDGVEGPAVPSEIASYASVTRLRHRFREAQIRKDLAQLSQIWSSLPRQWLVLKGPALGATVYAGRARDYRDLDVLVDGRDLGEAVDALQDNGARLMDRNFQLMNALGSGELSLTMPSGTMLDLHWHPLHTRRIRRAFRIDVAVWNARAVGFRFGDHAYRTIDSTDTLLYLAIHSCLSGAERLLWFKDIQLALASDWDEERLVDSARASGTGMVVATMMARTAHLLGSPKVTDRLLSRLSGNRGWRAASALLTRMSPPHRQWGKRPDRVFFRSSRTTTVASAQELTMTAIGDFLLRKRVDEAHAWRAFDWADGNPLWTDIDGGQRQVYFDAVAEEAARAAPAR